MKDICLEWTDKAFFIVSVCQCICSKRSQANPNNREEIHCQLGFIDFTAHSSNVELCMWLLWKIQTVCLHVQKQNIWKKWGKILIILLLVQLSKH